MKTLRSMAMLVLLGNAWLAGCGDAETEGLAPGDKLESTARLSKCGGFAQEQQGAAAVPASYCAAEVLTWSYSAGTLKLTDQRALLNCCGERTISARLEGGSYVVTERDTPATGASSRCRCMCVYDFELALAKVPEGALSVRLEREVTDSGEPARQLFAGTLETASGSGSVVLDTAEAAGWCGRATEVTQSSQSGDETSSSAAIALLETSPRISACGGFEATAAPLRSTSLEPMAPEPCAVEKLSWTYAEGKLSLLNQRVPLNCCGARSLDAVLEDGAVVITEHDKPADGAGRCRCSCAFDFAVDLKLKNVKRLPVKLVRRIAEDPDPSVVFTGELELSAGSGATLLHADPLNPALCR